MDSIFNKFGLFDFMGIWGPGAISVTYFSLTLHVPIRDLLALHGFSNPGFSDSHLLIILYTVIAYMVGVILHEFGRLLADLFNIFNASQVQLTISEDKKSAQGKSRFKDFCKRLCLFKQIRLKNIAKIHSVTTEKKEDFEAASSKIKFNNSSSFSQVDKYHSIYALARSLSLTFLLHLFVSLFVVFYSYIAPDYSYAISPWYYICDCALAFLFFLRAYRYFYYWVKSVYVQSYYISNRQ